MLSDAPRSCWCVTVGVSQVRVHASKLLARGEASTFLTCPHGARLTSSEFVFGLSCMIPARWSGVGLSGTLWLPLQRVAHRVSASPAVLAHNSFGTRAAPSRRQFGSTLAYTGKSGYHSLLETRSPLSPAVFLVVSCANRERVTCEARGSANRY